MKTLLFDLDGTMNTAQYHDKALKAWGNSTGFDGLNLNELL